MTWPVVAIKLPEESEWVCYLFGNRPGLESGLKWRPYKGSVPNRFVRWMMRLCFDCYWIQEETEQ